MKNYNRRIFIFGFIGFLLCAIIGRVCYLHDVQAEVANQAIAIKDAKWEYAEAKRLAAESWKILDVSETYMIYPRFNTPYTTRTFTFNGDSGLDEYEIDLHNSDHRCFPPTLLEGLHRGDHPHFILVERPLPKVMVDQWYYLQLVK